MKKTLSLRTAAAALIMMIFATGALSAATRNSKSEISDNLDIFNALVKELQTFYVDSIDVERSITTAIDAMLAGLDPYTEYIPEKDQGDFRTISTGEYGGIGSYIMERDGRTYISEPSEGSPAALAGLRPGDLIVMIDGDSVLTAGSDKVSERLKGQIGTKVRVRVSRPYVGADSILDFDITRATISIPSVPYYGVVGDSIGYIALTTFSEKTPDEMRRAVTDLTADKRIRGIIIDLRGNGGGVMESAVQVVSLFVPKGTEVLRTRGKGVLNEKIYKTTHSPIAPDIPLAVLIDGGTASASEIVTGALQDLDRAVVVGSRSFGKGLVQTSRPLPFDGLLKLTMAKYYIPSGRLIQAIDYSRRAIDGSASRIPDSLTTVFYTAAGRPVRDGGGIQPDSTVNYPDINRLVFNIVRDNWAFDYATKFAAEHPSIPPAGEFVITDSIFDDFKRFIDPDRLHYDKVCEVMVENLEKAATSEGYMNDSVRAQIDILRGLLRHNLDSDLDFNRQAISGYLSNNIVGRYYYRRGEIVDQLRDDQGYDAAAAILSDRRLYDSILAPAGKKKSK